jgi:hypothetical protein
LALTQNGKSGFKKNTIYNLEARQNLEGKTGKTIDEWRAVLTKLGKHIEVAPKKAAVSKRVKGNSRLFSHRLKSEVKIVTQTIDIKKHR